MRGRDLFMIAALSIGSTMSGCGEDLPQENLTQFTQEKPDADSSTAALDRQFADIEEPQSETLSADIGNIPRLAGRGKAPVDRLLSVCTARDENIDDGLARLVLITPYWVSQAMAGGAVYVRGGRTNEDGTECSSRAQADFVDRYMTKYTSGYQRPEECNSLYSRQCTDTLQKLYQEQVVDHFSGRYLCADCTTFIMQLYDCAFGTTQPYRTQPTTAPIISATPGAIKRYVRDTRNHGDKAIFNSWTDHLGKQHWGSRQTPDMGSCWDTIEKQIGHLRFGDVIQFPGHYAMYTGGLGLDYELVEMGAYAFSGTDIRTADVSFSFNGQKIPGIRVLADAQEALSGPHVRRGCVVRRVSSRPAMFPYKRLERRR